MPANDSPIWKLLTYTVVAVSAVTLLSVLYANGFDAAKDSGTVIGILTAMGVVDLVKAIFGGGGK